MHEHVYFIFVELGAQSEAFLIEGLAGGFVTVVCTANDIVEAIMRSRDALLQDGYEILDIDKALTFEPEEWRHDKSMQKLAKQAAKSKEVLYSEFGIWGH